MALQQTEDTAKFQGYLEKQSMTIFKTKKRRWVTLKDDKLYCYKTEKMQNSSTQIIYLNQFKSITTNNINAFTLIHYAKAGQNRTFRCNNKSKLSQWVKVIIPHLSRDEDGNHIIYISENNPILNAPGYNQSYQHRLHYYDPSSHNSSDKPTEIIDLNKYSSIKIHDSSTFVLIGELK